MSWRLAELGVAPLRQFARHPWSSCEVQNEWMDDCKIIHPNRSTGGASTLSPQHSACWHVCPQQGCSKRSRSRSRLSKDLDFPHLSLSLNLPLTLADFFSILLSEPADQQSTRVLGPSPSRLTSSRALFPSHFSPSL